MASDAGEQKGPDRVDVDPEAGRDVAALNATTIATPGGLSRQNSMTCAGVCCLSSFCGARWLSRRSHAIFAYPIPQRTDMKSGPRRRGARGMSDAPSCMPLVHACLTNQSNADCTYRDFGGFFRIRNCMCDPAGVCGFVAL